MYVRQLAGRQSGAIVEMNAEVAKAAIGQGTAAAVTDQEIHDDGFQAINRDLEVPPEQVLLGYRIEPGHDGGFNLLDAGGVMLNKAEEPFHNHPEARAAAIAFGRRARGLPDLFDPKSMNDAGGGTGTGTETSPFDKMNVEQMQAEAKLRGLDSSKATKKADWIALLKRDDEIKTALAAGQFDALTVPELQKVAADQSVDVTGKTAKADLVDAVKAGYKPPVAA